MNEADAHKEMSYCNLLGAGLQLLGILQLLFQFLDLLLEEIPLVFPVHGLFLDTNTETGA
ncbi:hypothetical protein EYF80_042410 [Liparis tanakae]|uniref:Uncharacterized protein n=1 Tax=Liparis tanakae TaxID=230148 RepID=A0A4Z2G1N7_9TELE|nr:hypothetical protein EYF80_042410 [Liparis tanakae]